MSAISEIYNCAHNILELADTFQMFVSKQLKRNIIITNKNGKYEFTDELPNDVRLNRISGLHEIIV